MDVVSAVSGYFSKMVSAGDNPSGGPSAKMKILLLDSETVRILSNKDFLQLTHIPTGFHRFHCDHTVRLTQPRGLPH